MSWYKELVNNIPKKRRKRKKITSKKLVYLNLTSGKKKMVYPWNIIVRT